jgi:cell division protein FtsW (lipid II flippase)
MDFPELKNNELGPAFLPRIYCGLLIIFGLILFIQGLLDKNKEAEKVKTFGYALMSMVIVFLYILVLPYIGFYISTVFAMLGLLLFSKVRRVLLLVSVPIGAVLFVYLVFELMLKVQIPKGSLFL